MSATITVTDEMIEAGAEAICDARGTNWSGQKPHAQKIFLKWSRACLMAALASESEGGVLPAAPSAGSVP